MYALLCPQPLGCGAQHAWIFSLLSMGQAGVGGRTREEGKLMLKDGTGLGERSRERKPSPETEIVSTFHPLAEYHEAYGPKKSC